MITPIAVGRSAVVRGHRGTMRILRRQFETAPLPTHTDHYFRHCVGIVSALAGVSITSVALLATDDLLEAERQHMSIHDHQHHR